MSDAAQNLTNLPRSLYVDNLSPGEKAAENDRLGHAKSFGVQGKGELVHRSSALPVHQIYDDKRRAPGVVLLNLTKCELERGQVSALHWPSKIVAGQSVRAMKGAVVLSAHAPRRRSGP